VTSVRNDSDVGQINNQVDSIAVIVGKVISETNKNGYPGHAAQLNDCRDRLLEAMARGRDLASSGVDRDGRDWRMWAQTLPPIAFELARETKELVQSIGSVSGPEDDEFS